MAHGHSRDCHGDLQAQHVCCTDPIRIFDCIAFNHRFRFGDTTGEIAFLAMDLERLGRPDLAVSFLTAYCGATRPTTSWRCGSESAPRSATRCRKAARRSAPIDPQLDALTTVMRE